MKILGYILIFCGIFSIPGFLANLSNAHDGYEFIGMMIGQGLIYFFAYLCLRKPKTKGNEIRNSKNDSTSESNVPREKITLDVDALSSNKEQCVQKEQLPVIQEGCVICKDVKEGITQNNADEGKLQRTENAIIEQRQEQLLRTSMSVNNEKIVKPQSTPIVDEVNKKSWQDIEDILFNAFKIELKKCCSPANFIVPYDHDKIELANEMIIKIDDSKSLVDLKDVYVEMRMLDVVPTCDMIYEYLLEICKPTRFVGKGDEFRIANNLYCRVLSSKENYEEQIALFEEARTSIKLRESSHNKFARNLNYILFVMICEFINMTLLVYNGVLYNATSYFYPIQTKDIAKYDYTEFIVYGVMPILVCGIIKVLNSIISKYKLK